jgi:predicted glutamine amidotransferase
MCELMGMCFSRPISADFTIREFALRCQENADGWGLAWYPDRSLAVIKEPVRWQMSQFTGFLEKYQSLLSPIYIAHVRHRTVGSEPTHADTHPFARECKGREYCFAHNGTLTNLSEAFALGRYHPIGSTDSEYIFCHILEGVAAREHELDSEPDWRWLHDKLTALNSRGKLNCLLSDGQRLFAYRDAAGFKGLSFRKVNIRSHETRRFEDQEFQVSLGGEPANHGFVIATQPLSPHGWHELRAGELIVLEAGNICFSSHRSPIATDSTSMTPPATESASVHA